MLLIDIERKGYEKVQQVPCLQAYYLTESHMTSVFTEFLVQSNTAKDHMRKDQSLNKSSYMQIPLNKINFCLFFTIKQVGRHFLFWVFYRYEII